MKKTPLQYQELFKRLLRCVPIETEEDAREAHLFIEERLSGEVEELDADTIFNLLCVRFLKLSGEMC